MERRLIFRHKYLVDMVIFPKKNDPLSKAIRKKTASQNFTKTTHSKGTISKNGMKNVKSHGESYLLAVYYHRQLRRSRGLPSDAYNTFITLTLPSKQVHSDEEIKRQCLTPFLSYVTRTKGSKGYIWRAELQKNGNIHFHMFVDVYIPHQWLREVWNNTLSPLGYLDAFEKAHGHRNPNSTDIERVGKIDKAVAYLSKYIAKENGKQPRDLDGRHYGMSDNIRMHAKPFTLSDYDRAELINNFDCYSIEFEKKVINDFAAIIYNDKTTRENLHLADPLSMKQYISHYLTIAQNMGLK